MSSEEKRKTGGARQTRSGKSRPTIGLLMGQFGDQRYQADVWPGIADTAEERDVNLICFVGRELRSPRGFDVQGNVIYDLVGPENVDGLVALSGTLGHYIDPTRLGHFYKRFRPLPIITVSLALEGIPAALVDNRKGISETVAHLIDAHGCRRIAFIRGPEGHQEADQRYAAYVETLEEYGLPLDPELVAPGDFVYSTGTEAIRLLLDERKLKMDAIVAANDESALGTLAALQERGIRVPGDLAVVGFDDVEEARFAAPPLTTARQPLYEQGKKATEMLLALLAGESVPEQVVLPTALVVRQSCGCLPQTVTHAAANPILVDGRRGSADLAARRRQILRDLRAVAPVSLEPHWAEHLFDAFTADLAGSPSGSFLQVLRGLLQQVEAVGADVSSLQDVVSVLRRRSLPHLASREQAALADDLWQQARVLIGETVEWVQAHRRMQAARRSELLSQSSESLMTTFDLEALPDAAAHELPHLGIRSCYLSLYEDPAGGDPESPAEKSNLILAYTEKGRVTLEPGGRLFSSRQLVPRGLLPRGRRYTMMLEPLRFRDEAQLGFALFEPLKSAQGALIEIISRQIGTAIRGALIMQERRQAEQILKAGEQAERHFQEQLRTLLEVSNELSRADSVDALCRRAVELGRQRFGFDRLGIWFRGPDPDTVIGSFGTDKSGNVCDERALNLPAGAFQKEVLSQKRPAIIRDEGELYDGERNVIGHGAKAMAAMWDGEQTIGLVALDNFLHQRPITDHDCELLNLYASTLGYLCSRKQAEEALKEYSERLEEMVEARTGELREALEKAQLADHLKSEFVANVNHELRTPLTNLLLYYQILRSNPGVKTDERLDVIGRELQRLRGLIEELLLVSRLDQGQTAFFPKLHDLNRIIQTLMDDRRALAEERGLTLVANLSPALPPIWVDEQLIVQAVSNLLTNALNYTPSGGTVYLRTASGEGQPGGPWVTFSVQDTGPGISDEDLPHLFERFYRGRAGHDTRTPGTGLGLSIVKQVIEKHSGRIAVTHAAGGCGAIFTVWLPIDQGQPAG